MARPAVVVALSVVAGVALGGGVYVATGSLGGQGAVETNATAVEGTTPAGSAAPAPTPAHAPASASAPAQGDDAPAACGQAEVNACLVASFPPYTFLAEKDPDLSFICEESNPTKASDAIKVKVVRAAGGELTDAMKQWAVLGWYKHAAFVAMRSRCCGSPPPLTMPPHPETCGEIATALSGVGDVARKASPSAEEREAATSTFTEAVLCLSRARSTKAFGQAGAPNPGEQSTFTQVFERIVAAPACSATP